MAARRSLRGAASGRPPAVSRAAAYFFTTFQKNASVEGITPLTSFR